MYGIFTYIYPKSVPNVVKYSIHGASGYIYIYKVTLCNIYARDSVGLNISGSPRPGAPPQARLYLCCPFAEL